MFCQAGSEKLICIENEVKDMAMLNDGLREKITFLTQVWNSVIRVLIGIKKLLGYYIPYYPQ